jgi:hypothetical protein
VSTVPLLPLAITPRAIQDTQHLWAIIAHPSTGGRCKVGVWNFLRRPMQSGCLEFPPAADEKWVSGISLEFPPAADEKWVS